MILLIVVFLVAVALAFLAGYVVAHIHLPTYLAALSKSELVTLTAQVEKRRE